MGTKPGRENFMGANAQADAPVPFHKSTTKDGSIIFIGLSPILDNVLAKMPDFLRNPHDDASPSAVLVTADVRVVLLVPIVCSHV